MVATGRLCKFVSLCNRWGENQQEDRPVPVPKTVTVLSCVTVATVTSEVPRTGGVYVYKVDIVIVVNATPSGPLTVYVMTTSETVGAGGESGTSVEPE